MERRELLAAAATGIGLLAGCTGGGVPAGAGDDPTPDDTPTPSETQTPTDDGRSTPTTPGDRPGSPHTHPPETPVDPRTNFPEGPKDPPERPDDLTEDSVREFVHEFEYRYVYNEMWFGEGTEVTNECEVDGVESVESGFEVVVSCTAYANKGGEPKETGTGTTTVVHSDYFTQTYVYLVTEDSLSRRPYRGESTPG